MGCILSKGDKNNNNNSGGRGVAPSTSINIEKSGSSGSAGDKSGAGGLSSSPSSSALSPGGFLVDSKSLAKGRVDEVYEIGEELGRGTFSVVKEGTHRKTKQKLALKFIDKKFVDKDDIILLRREIEIMKKVQHENVLSLKEIYETETNLTLVVELVNGGELFFKIVEQGSYSEKDASNIVRQIVNGVRYLHGQGIAHRDLKPENLLCSFPEDGDDDNTTNSNNSSGMTIKIADFGLSKIFAGGQQLETSCGTPDYAAPEVLTGEQAYDKSVDLWSVGVITYVLLCGFPPFYASSQPALFEKIIHADYDFPEPEWNYISDTAKDFIRNLLVLEPVKRLTVEQCLAHPFLAGSAGTQMLNIEKSMTKYNVQRKKAKNQMDEK
jgi:calcium/calmodulin-dependent protein kinase I